jgi:hypothetical protein
VYKDPLRKFLNSVFLLSRRYRYGASWLILLEPLTLFRISCERISKPSGLGFSNEEIQLYCGESMFE